MKRSLLACALVCSLVVTMQTSIAAVKGKAKEAPKSAANARIEAIQKELNSLSETTQQAKTACQDFVNQAKQIIGQPAQKGPPIATKKQALELLALLKKYPGIPEAARRLWVGYFQQSQSTDALSAQPVLGSYICEPGAYFEIAQVLVGTMDQLKFSGKEKRELAEVLFDRARQDLSGGAVTFLPLQTSLGMLQMGLNSKILDASDVIYLEVLNQGDRLNELRERLQELSQKTGLDAQTSYDKLNASQKGAVRQSILFELRDSTRIADRLLALMLRMGPAKP